MDKMIFQIALWNLICGLRFALSAGEVCPIFSTTDQSYDWRLPSVDNPSRLDVSVRTANSMGVWIALNSSPGETDVMYEIAIGVEANTCSIKKLGTNKANSVSRSDCGIQATDTEFWISIDETKNQIQVGWKGVNYHFLNLWDNTDSGGLRISDIRYIGVKAHDAGGATWSIPICNIETTTKLTIEQPSTVFKTSTSKIMSTELNQSDGMTADSIQGPTPEDNMKSSSSSSQPPKASSTTATKKSIDPDAGSISEGPFKPIDQNTQESVSKSVAALSGVMTTSKSTEFAPTDRQSSSDSPVETLAPGPIFTSMHSTPAHRQIITDSSDQVELRATTLSSKPRFTSQPSGENTDTEDVTRVSTVLTANEATLTESDQKPQETTSKDKVAEENVVISECPVFNTTDPSSYDWHLPSLGNTTRVDFSVRTPNSMGVKIALNAHPYDSEGMYEIAIGAETGKCEITKRGTDINKLITVSRCKIQDTFSGLWIEINSDINQFYVGREDESKHFMNLYDESSGDEPKIADIQYIGFKPTHGYGALWNITSMCSIVTEAPVPESTTTRTTTPMSSTAMSSTNPQTTKMLSTNATPTTIVPTTVTTYVPTTASKCSSSDECTAKLRETLENFGPINEQNFSKGSSEQLQKLQELNKQLVTLLDNLEPDQAVKISSQDIVIEVVRYDSADKVQSYAFIPDNSTQKTFLKIANNSVLNSDSIGIVAFYVSPSYKPQQSEDKNSSQSDSSSNEGNHVASGIMSFSVVTNGNETSVGVNFDMEYKEIKSDTDVKTAIKCVFWDFNEGFWSDVGCNVVKANEQVTSCSCNHTTNFAILMEVEGILLYRVSDAHKRRLDLISKSLGIISIICFCATIFVYKYLKLTSSLGIKVHANLCASLALGFLLFLTAVNNTTSDIACKAFALIIHYLFLVAFMWMMIEGMLLYQKTRKSGNVPPKWSPVCFLAWGLPILIVIITAVIRFDQYDNQTCWLSEEKGARWALTGPALLVVGINTVVLGIVMRTFMQLKMNQDKSEVERIKTAFRAVLIMTPILGLPWIFSVFIGLHIIFQYLFIILVSSQGIFVFICYCLMNGEVKKAYNKKRGKVAASDADKSNSTKMSGLDTRIGGQD